MAKKRRPPPEPPADPDKFKEAIDAWRARVPMTPDAFALLEEAERAHAFTVAGVTQANAVQEVFDAIERAIEHGTTLDDFKDEVGGTLAEAWAGEDAARTETLFRTSVMQSYNEGRDAIFSDPAVREVRPYLRVDGCSDNRQCDICGPLDGLVLPADDPFWATHKFPLHPGDRCVVTALTHEEAHDEGVSRGAPEAEPPAEGFGTHADYEPDLSGYDPAIRDALAERLK